MTTTYRRISGDLHLSLRSDICLAVRMGMMACAMCATVCPVDALSVGNDGPTIKNHCIGCGACASVCPTGALKTVGFDDTALPNGNFCISIECWKIPAAISGTNSIRIPCLRGIALGQLLEWIVAAGSRSLTLVDRGWCTRCSASQGEFPAQTLLAAAQPWLDDCGVPSAMRPRIKSEPLPATLMPAAIPDADSQIAMGRRAFFVRLGREIARSERPAEPPSGPRAALRREVCPLPARGRLLAALGELARANGRGLPPRALPAVSVGPDCRDHGLCAGLCPTGALWRTEDDTGITLEFEASRCIACGRCAEHCPEEALTVSASGGELERIVVKRHAIVVCLECGRAFARTDTAQKICGQCESRRNLARNLFGHG